LAPRLSDPLGQLVIVEIGGGAGGRPGLPGRETLLHYRDTAFGRALVT
jgi:hypothetical protein